MVITKPRTTPLKLELNYDELRRSVEDAFAEEFGKDFIRDIYVTKYPEAYSVVVFVKKKEVDRMFTLSHQLMDQFEQEGFSVTISTREVP